MEEFDLQGIMELLMSGDPVAVGLAVVTVASIALVFIAKKTKSENDDKVTTKIYNVLKRLTVKNKE